MTQDMNCAVAFGGAVAASEAVELWGHCALGLERSNNRNLPNHERLCKARDEVVNAAHLIEAWSKNKDYVSRRETLKTIRRSAFHLLAVANDYAVIRDRAKFRSFSHTDEWSLLFDSQGFASNSHVKIVVNLPIGDGSRVSCSMGWDTGWENEGPVDGKSTLCLPFMTDGADIPEHSRRGGWRERVAMPREYITCI